MSRTVPLDRLEFLANDPRGLTEAEVTSLTAQYGPNLILEAGPSGWLEVLRETSKDPMLWFLLGTAGLFAVLGQWIESAVLLMALLPLLGMDAYLHQRTHASVQGLSSRLASTASVERDGTIQSVPASALVPGDLVILSVGDAIPADGLLVSGERMQADESALTGEAFPVGKSPLARWPGNREESAVDKAAWGFAGTRMLTGRARMRVVFTGAETLYGQIARSAAEGTHARTPLQTAVDRLVRVLVIGALVLCLVLAWVRYQQGHGLVDALVSALTLAIAALPEEFPVVLTFFLGVGVYRLAKRQALVRRAVVVENIGRVSCICSDKTGTITEGRLLLGHREADQEVGADRLLELAAIASRRETGDPMDTAILDAYATAPDWETVATFPFTEDRRRETGIVRHHGDLLAAAKGAPEVVLAQCDLSPEALAYWSTQVAAYATGGHKVIACAWRPLQTDAWTGAEPDQAFRFAGLLCFEDPVRPGVVAALQACQTAGIRVVMVTGDHLGTATAVAAEIGLGGKTPRVVDASEMSARLARNDTGFLRDVDVIARAIPAQKLDLVRALQAQGEIVAVTGDGVNDVPALQAADIGIAMGIRGTRSAREIASIVLLDDDFASIVSAIAEGCQLFTNLQLSFQYLLMIHFPLVITAALLPLAGYPVLYLPVHIVWLELIIHPTALLVFQALPDQQGLARVRRTGTLQFFDRTQWVGIVSVATLVTAVVTFAFLRGLESNQDVDHARAIALSVLTMSSAGSTAGLTRLRGRPAQVMIAATLLCSFVLVESPWLAPLLHLKPLDVDDWLLVIGGAGVASVLAWLPTLQGPGRRSSPPR